MTREMRHDEASESLAAAALDALPADEQAAVLEHAAACDLCGPELEALRQALAALGNSTPAPSAPASADVEQRLKRIRVRLLARAQADLESALMNAAPSATATARDPAAAPGSGAAAPGSGTAALGSGPAAPGSGAAASGSAAPGSGAAAPGSGAPRSAATSPASTGAVAEGAALRGPGWRSGLVPWLALAAAIVIAVLLVNQVRSTNAALAQASQNAAAAKAALDTAQAKIAQANREIKDLTGPKTSVVSLGTTGAAEATALMFWDKTDNSWAFYAHQMPPPPAGKTYQIWLLTHSGEKISAGTFTPAADSSVEVHATYALPRDALTGVAVSEEPAGGVPQPTGRIVIIGTPGSK